MKRWSFLAVLLVLAGRAWGFDLFGDKSAPSFMDNGDTVLTFAIPVGSTNTTTLYTRRATGTDRRLVVCNQSAAFLWVSTTTTIDYNVSPKTMVAKGICQDLPTNMTLYGKMDVASASATIVGFSQYQARD